MAQTDPHAEPTHSDKAILLQLEHQWADTSERRDTAFLNNLLDDRFIDTSYKGQIRTKADAMAGPAAPSAITKTLRDLRVRIFGNTAIVTGLNIVHAKDHSLTARIRFTDIFFKRKNQWKAIGAQETMERATTATDNSEKPRPPEALRLCLSGVLTETNPKRLDGEFASPKITKNF